MSILMVDLFFPQSTQSWGRHSTSSTLAWMTWSRRTTPWITSSRNFLNQLSRFIKRCPQRGWRRRARTWTLPTRNTSVKHGYPETGLMLHGGPRLGHYQFVTPLWNVENIPLNRPGKSKLNLQRQRRQLPPLPLVVALIPLEMFQHYWELLISI